MSGGQATHPTGSLVEGEADECTLIFTDIEGSTGLLEYLGDRYPEALTHQFTILREQTRVAGGEEVNTHGDEFFVAFADPLKAVEFAVATQRQLYEAEWPSGATVRVRMGIHTGRPFRTLVPRLDFSGIDVHRAARIAKAGHGGQIVISAETRERIDSKLIPGATIRNLGTFKLKDIRFPEALYDIVVDGLPSRFGPIRTTEGRPGNLPSDLSPFIGREKQVSAVQAALLDPKTRLVTITGTGGSGKTRLAIETARRAEGRFKDGAFFVSMVPISSPRLMAPSIAQSLGISEQHGRPVAEIIKNAIHHREILVVIDNFEHILPAAPVLSELLSACPGLKFLVTSREALGILPEHEYPLKPMETPAAKEASVDSLLSCEAIAFFVGRAQAIRPEFHLEDRHARTVNEICRRLDGLPLALELAASRLRLLEPDQLLKRLDERLEALGRDEWSLSDRHKTMRNAIGWSYNLLNETERRLFSAASIFAGSFTIEAMASLAQVPLKVAFASLDSLVRKSMLQRTVSDGEVRLSLLDLLKDYGIEQAKEAAILEDLLERHLDYIVGLVEANSDPLLSPTSASGTRVLVPEISNIRAALERAIEKRNAPAIAALLKHLLWFWIARSQFSEAEGWISRALVATGDLVGSEERTIVTDVAGWHHVLTGDWSAALPHFQECRISYHRLRLAREESFATMMEGITGISHGAGLSAIKASLAGFRAQEDDYGIAIALIALGEAARLGGQHAEAQPLLQEALGRMRRLGNSYWTVAVLQNLAHVKLSFGDWQTAADLLKEAMELGRAAEDTTFAHYYASAMGQVAVLSGELELAAKLFGAIEASIAATGFRFEPADHFAFERARAEASKNLGLDKFRALSEAGKTWTLEQAIDAAYAFRYL